MAGFTFTVPTSSVTPLSPLGGLIRASYGLPVVADGSFPSDASLGLWLNVSLKKMAGHLSKAWGSNPQERVVDIARASATPGTVPLPADFARLVEGVWISTDAGETHTRLAPATRNFEGLALENTSTATHYQIVEGALRLAPPQPGPYTVRVRYIFKPAPVDITDIALSIVGPIGCEEYLVAATCLQIARAEREDSNIKAWAAAYAIARDSLLTQASPVDEGAIQQVQDVLGHDYNQGQPMGDLERHEWFYSGQSSRRW